MTNINSLWIQNFRNIIMKNIDIFNITISNMIFIIRIFLSFIIMYLFKNKNSINFLNDRNELEIFWTIIPTLIIIIIAIPSIFLLYCYEENKFSFIDIKIIANQWYWIYEYPNNKIYDRYIKSRNLIRVVTTNNSIIIPTNKIIRLILSSNDVLHSWTVPRLITKIDAIPGRLNMILINSKKSIIMKGQCSEICGINHSFIPISVISINSLSSNGWGKH